MCHHHILVVEDDKDISENIKKILNYEGFLVTLKSDGRDLIEDTNMYDLILMDIMLPYQDGIVLAKKIKSIRKIPILFLTARHDIKTKLEGLKLGEDYLPKPFDPLELIARINNIINSYYGPPNYKIENITVQLQEKRLFIKQKEIILTKTEKDLFFYLFENKNHNLEKEQIINYLWPWGEATDSILAVYIKKLREKLDDTDSKIIKTVYGIGYRLNTFENE
ncbi:MULTISPECIES: response regulator transcription factor [Mammaliicoccus]|uniref:response regulator transcription factor n=1 Tax=Mammaliicoccus TaxID=2803850 RepID=UPI001EFC2B01|nr:response regulator transcription factor [Mammaliicoccus sp. J-M41]